MASIDRDNLQSAVKKKMAAMDEEFFLVCRQKKPDHGSRQR